MLSVLTQTLGDSFDTAPDFFLVFRKFCANRVLSWELWSGTAASAGALVLGSGRNYAVYKNWKDSTQRQQWFGQ